MKRRIAEVPNAATIEYMHLSIPGTFVLTSKAQEGKSHLINYACYEHRDEIDFAFVISTTAFDEGNLPFVPDRFKFSSWPGEKTKEHPRGVTKEALDNLIDEQMKIPKHRRPLVAIIIEDEFECLKDPKLAAIASRPTHYNVW
jgi:hypothetical protein